MKVEMINILVDNPNSWMIPYIAQLKISKKGFNSVNNLT